MKGIISLSIPKCCSDCDKMALRAYLRNIFGNDYKINLIISGDDDFKDTLKNIIKARINS